MENIITADDEPGIGPDSKRVVSDCFDFPLSQTPARNLNPVVGEIAVYNDRCAGTINLYIVHQTDITRRIDRFRLPAALRSAARKDQVRRLQTMVTGADVGKADCCRNFTADVRLRRNSAALPRARCTVSVLEQTSRPVLINDVRLTVQKHERGIGRLRQGFIDGRRLPSGAVELGITKGEIGAVGVAERRMEPVRHGKGEPGTVSRCTEC